MFGKPFIFVFYVFLVRACSITWIVQSASVFYGRNRLIGVQILTGPFKMCLKIKMGALLLTSNDFKNPSIGKKFLELVSKTKG